MSYSRSTSKSGSRRDRSLQRRMALLSIAMILSLLVSLFPQVVGQPMPTASAHNLQTRMVYMYMDPTTQAMLDARMAAPGWTPPDPLLQSGDELGIIIKVVPRDGTNTGVGGHVDFYIPTGVQVVDAAYLTPDGSGGYTRSPMKGQSPIAIGAGPIGAKTTSQLMGWSLTLDSPNGMSQQPVVPASGLHRGTIAGVYGDTGIFYSTDPDTAYGSWQAFTGDSNANGCGSLAYHPTVLGKTLVNNSGDTVVPCNKWDAEQLMAWGVKGGTYGAAAPIVDYGDGRGNAPWGFASGVAGPQSGYAWMFDWDEWQASAKDATAMQNAMQMNGTETTQEIGPWQRIRYPGSKMSLDQPGLASSVLGYASMDASTLGVAASTLPATVSQTDDTSPKVIRWAVGQLTAYRPEYVWVKIKVNSAAEITTPSGCPVFKGDTFGGDAGGTDNGKDHLWRYYEPTETTWNGCLAAGKPATREIVKVGDTFQYKIKVYNLQNFNITNVKVTDMLPSGVTFVSATPAQNSGPNPLQWIVGTLLPGQKFEATVTVKASGMGYLDNVLTITSDQLPPQIITETTESGLYPYLVPTKSVTPASIAPGGSVEYTILVKNVGTGASGTPVTVEEYLPAGFTYDSSYTPVVTANGANIMGTTVNATNPAAVLFTVPSAINGGSQMTIKFKATAAASLAPGSYCNSYRVTQNAIPITTGAEACVTVAGGKIGDTIWRDWDGDGMQDAGEEGIAGVTVKLYEANGTTLKATTTTDANGNYYFTGLEPGTYVVKANDGTTLTGYTQTGDPDTTIDNMHTVALALNQQYLTADFGYEPTGAAIIGDKVFEDIGNDGMYNDGVDAGIANVTVWLYEDTNGDGKITAGVDALVATAESGADGSYSFTGLAEGYDYLVKVDTTDSAIQTYFNAKYDPDPVTFQLSTAETTSSLDLTGSDLDNDFGFWRALPASIGDQLFIDADGDSLYDTGEAPVAGVTVNLYRDGMLVATTVSGPDGAYLFDNLGPGSYTVAVDATDPDIPGGYFPAISSFSKTLIAGEDYLGADFPFVALISKTVDKIYAAAGETLTFGVNVDYPGDELLSDVTVRDFLPLGTTFSAAGQGGALQTFSSVAGMPGIDSGSSGPGTVSLDYNSIDDTWLNGDSTGTNYGATVDIRVDPETSKPEHAIIRFTLPSTLPDDATVTSASLSLTKLSGSAIDIVARQADNQWAETQATWLNRLTGTAWDTPGGDFIEDSADPVVSSGTATTGLRTWSVPHIVQNWLDGAANYGFLLRHPLENLGNTSNLFASSENPTIASRPTLTFSYTSTARPATNNTITASPVIVAVGSATTVVMSLTSSQAVAGVTPSALAVSGGAATCTGPTPASLDLAANVAGVFAWSCVPTHVGEFAFSATATNGTVSFRSATSNSVLASPNGENQYVIWNLGSNDSGSAGTTAANKSLYAFQGADTLAFWAYNVATGVWNNPLNPEDTPTGVTIKEGGALTNDGIRYIYALRGDATRVFLRYDALNDDTATVNWNDGVVADLPATTTKTVLKGGALVYLNGYVYAFVGQDTLDFWRYDVAANSWAKMANALGTVNNGAGLTTDGTNIYATRGDGSTGFWRYNVSGNTWTALTPTPANVGDGGGLVYANGAIYVQRGGGQLTFWRYNIAANNWTVLAPAPANIDDGGAIAFDGASIYVLRGKTNVFYRYNIAANTWTTLATAPATVGWGGALTFLATGNVSHTEASAAPTLVSGVSQVVVRMTVTSENVVSNITAVAPAYTATGGATATFSAAALVSADDDISGHGDPVIYEWTATVTPGSSIGEIVFTTSSNLGASANSNSVLVVPTLTYQASVTAGAPPVIKNTAVLNETGGTVENVPSNTTETATTGSIGDYVWADTDGDGVQDTGEYGLAGLRVYVDSNNNGVWDAGEPYDITNSGGHYRIFGLQPGVAYTVRTDATTYPDGYLPTTSSSLSVTLAAGEQYSAADFGLQPPPPPSAQGSIGDYIWLDADKDGVQDEGELPLAGITVKLYRDLNNDGVLDATDTLAGTDVTDAEGLYTFEGLAYAGYIVVVDQTSPVTSPYDPMVTSTLGGVGGAMAPTYDKDGGLNNQTVVTVNSTTPIADVDFGYNWAGSIGDRTWYDTDADGVQDTGETAGAPNATVVLVYDTNGNGAADPGEPPIGTYVTCGGTGAYACPEGQIAGAYLFDNLPPGDYVVQVSEQEVPSPTTGNIGVMIATTGSSHPVTLDPAQDYSDADFGFVEGSSIAGSVWHDANGNGVMDAGETPLANVTVTLTGLDALGNPVTHTVETGADGSYFFVTPPGTYTITYAAGDIPTGLSEATTPASITMVVPAGAEITDQNFGVDSTGKLGNFVWNDANSNGTWNAGEPGLPGVTVRLYDSTGTTLLATTVTDSAGNYQFVGLADGSYVVKVDTSTVPAGYTASGEGDPGTACGTGCDNAITASVSGGGTNNTVDFGYKPPTTGVYTVTGNVWRDNNGDGERGDNARDIKDVRVCLYEDTNNNGFYDQGEPPFACTFTDASGNYSFPGVPNGSYVVAVDTTTLPNAAYTPSSESTPSDPWNPCASLGCDSQSAVTVSGANPPVENFGYYENFGSISGAVCVGDSDGICESGEPPIAGVTVTLKGAGPDGILGTADDSTATTTTNASGAYSFTNLPPGLYQVVETNLPNSASLADRDGGNPDNITVNLGAGQEVTGRDFEDYGGADLAVTKTDGLALIVPGQQLTYTLTVANNGILPAAGVVLTDEVGANLTYVESTCGTPTIAGSTYTWSLADLAVGASFSCTVTVDVASGLADGVTVTNYASITTTTLEPNVTDNEYSDIDTIQSTPAPDLQITKTDSQTQVLAGASLAYVITYKNVGNATATGVVVIDQLPANVAYVSSSPSGTYDSNARTITWSIGDLAQGGEASITVNVTVNSNLLPGAVVLNRVSITTTGTDRNLADNTASDSDIVVAPYVVIEKSVTGPAYVGGEVTYTIHWQNNSTDTANDVIITDVLPANTTVAPNSISAPGAYDSDTRTITWNLGSQEAGDSGTVSFKVTVNTGAGGALQTTPTLSTETGAGNVTVTSKTAAYTSLPWCDSTFNPKCLTYRGLYQGSNNIPPAGWNDNPRATAFNDAGWTQPVTATIETFHWLPAATLAAEWTAVNTSGVTTPNYTFFRQAFCLPLNASSLGASLDLANDDISTVYLNGIQIGSHRGAGAYSTLSGNSGIQSGINILAVQLLNNTHGGHALEGGEDHSGLLFNLDASYGSLRPFASAPSMILAGQTATISVDENALGGRTPYGYRVDWGDGTVVDYLNPPSSTDPRNWTHTYSTPGAYVATVTARAQYGCTGTDQATITVLPTGSPEDSKILANAAHVAYKNTAGKTYSGDSGAGIKLNMGTVTGFVYVDANGDGTYTAGIDTPASGVQVHVTDAYGVVHTATTGADGAYTVTEVGAGYATVDLVNPPAGVQTQGTDATTGVLVSAGYTTFEENNGFYNPTAVGNKVWLDENGDGIQDPGEASIANVTVQLWNSDHSAIVATTVTDADGSYIFKGMPAGVYQVGVLDSSLPAGLVHSTPTFTGDFTNKADPYTVTVTAGAEIMTADFGYNWAPSSDVTGNTNTGAIGDRVWIDADGDGAQDPEELGLPGVTVQLWYDSNNDGVIDALYPGGITTTNATGNYVFDNLPAGIYEVQVGAGVAGYTQTGDPDTFLDGMTTQPIVLAAGDVYVNADFGYQPGAGMGATIGDRIWLDADADHTGPAGTPGGMDGEQGIPGVTVSLIRDTNADGVWDRDGADNILGTADDEPIVATDITDALGYYQFTGVPVMDGIGTDDYLVWVNDTANILAGLAPTYDNNGTGTPNISAVSNLTSDGDLLQDFGYTPYGQTTARGLIGDTIFLDRDGSGGYTAGEGLEGVTVRLYDSTSATLLATTVTDENGNYYFPGLPGGTYTVVVDTATLPGGLTNTVDPDTTSPGDSQSTVVLAAGGINLAQDFGYDGTNSVSGTLWRDTDADGYMDASETSWLAGVTVALYDANGDIVATTTTDASGNYSFANLPNGAYTVHVTDAANVLDGYWHSLGTPDTDNNSQSDPLTVVLDGNETINYADFGYYRQPASLGDFVWQDTNGNGIQDSGEPGIAGVEVTLTITWPGGATTRVTTMTGANGAYSFGNLLLGENFDGAGAGEPIFNITVATPAGYIPTLTDVESNTRDAEDSDLNGVAATITEGASNTTYDFGLLPRPGAIGDTIWLDENSDGVQDAGEAGIPNVKVTLTGTAYNGATVSLTTYTGANGEYVFADVPPGSYTVTVDPDHATTPTLPAGLWANPTYDEDGLGTAHTSTVTLLPGQEHLSADFGYNWAATTDVTGNTGTGAIGDHIWIDADGDGVQDAHEAGLSGVTVKLYTDPDGDGVYDTLAATTTTDAAGNYIFDGLDAGAYVVEVVPPAGYASKGDPDQPGMMCTACDNKTTAPIVLAPGDVYVNADFGYQLISGPNTIGNRIFLDANGDGTLDMGEPGIAGVTVALLDSGGKVIATTITDAAGAYSFSGLPDGTYTVWVNDTANVLDALAQSSTPDNANDGGQPCGACTGRNTVTVSGGASSMYQDFGYTPVGQGASDGLIGDTIYLDRDGGNDYDAGEGLEGVIVRLYADTNGDGNYDIGEPMLAQAVTDENGTYAFGNLPAGNYVVAVDTASLPAGVTNTVDPDIIDSPLNEAGVTVSAESLVHLDQDFGYRDETFANTISGTIWVDTNADGTLVETTELGRYAGVTVVLYDTAGNVVAMTTTGSDGNYSFANLPDGTYRVDVTDDANILNGAWLSDGPNDGMDGNSQADPYTVTVSGGQTNTTADFGYYRGPAALGNFVWDDLDGDGIQDSGEPGIAGVEVTLTITWPDAMTTAVTTLTGANGAYSFGNLLLDEHFNGATADGSTEPAFSISVATPAGHVASPQNQTTEDLDSDNPSGQPASLTEGNVDNSYDFGFTRGASVGDSVWLDVDGDGVQDVGEPGIANVKVELYSGETLVATTYTDANGNYLFTDVPPGTNYTVTVDEMSLPAGLTESAGMNPTAAFTLAPGQEKLDVDFGYTNASTTTAIVGDLVWNDANANGVQDPGEAGIAGVTVALVGPGADGVLGTADDATVATATTGPDGSYLFTGVMPGEHRVDVTDTGSKLTGYTLVSGVDPSLPLTVAAGGIYLEADFGYRNTALFSISDKLWQDWDGDGMQDAGEPGIPGVTVNLLDGNGKVVATAITGPDGSFTFSDVPAGSYTLQVTDNTGELAPYLPTTTGATGGSTAVTVAASDVSGTHFGYRQPGVIGDTIWSDANGDGMQDAGELGIAGVEVKLYLDDGDGIYEPGAGDALISTEMTSAAGEYLFTNLLSGAFWVAATMPGGYAQTGDPDESGACTTCDNLAKVVLSVTQPGYLAADFGYRNNALANVSGSLWNDLNSNARDDGMGEPPIAGVTVALLDGSGNVVATAVTAADGSYTFGDVPAGSYTVAVTDQGGVLQGYTLTSGLDRIPVTVGATDITGVDFGYVRTPNTGSIGDFVWLDADRDGVQDGGEGGISGVNVSLYRDANGNGVYDAGTDVLVATTTTDANGGYVFTGVGPGAYFVDVDQTTLPCATCTVKLAPTTGTTDPRPVSLSEGEAYVTADFGYTSATGQVIGDRIWHDVDGDGIQDPGEPGIGGVSITVTGPSCPAETPCTVTTDPDGSWLVAGLTAGNYTVAVTPPSGYAATPTNQNENSIVFVAEAGKDVLYADFGYKLPTGTTYATLGDRIWQDADGDGMQDAGEAGIVGVTVNLLDNTGKVVATTTTGADGTYQFTGVPDGAYTVQVTDVSNVLAGSVQTYERDNSLGGQTALVISGGQVTEIGGVACTNCSNELDFGHRPAGGVIGNQVWHDLNGDGHRDAGELGLEGVTIGLWLDVNGDGAITPGVDNLVRTTATDENGQYSFTGLSAGKYLVDVTDKAGVLAGMTLTDGTDNADNYSQVDPYPVELTLTAGAVSSNYTADFGYKATAPYTISGTVFEDSNHDGALSAEPPVPYAPVYLYRDLDGDGVIGPNDPLIGVTTSAADGTYSFADLPAGKYVVTTDVSNTSASGYYQSTQTNTGVQGVTLTSASSTGNNFGFYPLSFSPLAVDLAFFTAEATGDGVSLTWETVSETDNAGFNIYRAEESHPEPVEGSHPEPVEGSHPEPVEGSHPEPVEGSHPELVEGSHPEPVEGSHPELVEGAWVKLNAELIPAAAPGASEGYSYTWVDATVTPGARYVYRLDTVALDGTTETVATTIVSDHPPRKVLWLPLISRQ